MIFCESRGAIFNLTIVCRRCDMTRSRLPRARVWVSFALDVTWLGHKCDVPHACAREYWRSLLIFLGSFHKQKYLSLSETCNKNISLCKRHVHGYVFLWVFWHHFQSEIVWYDLFMSTTCRIYAWDMTLQHTVTTLCNALQPTATHCNHPTRARDMPNLRMVWARVCVRVCVCVLICVCTCVCVCVCMIVCVCACGVSVCVRVCVCATGWSCYKPRRVSCTNTLSRHSHCPQKSPIISRSFAKILLQLKASPHTCRSPATLIFRKRAL